MGNENSASGDALPLVPASTIQVEVIYAAPQRTIAKTMRLSGGSTVADALRIAELDSDFVPVLAIGLANPEPPAVGIFGKLTPLDRELEEGDRVEIYRPLAADPKTARRARAREAAKSRRGR